MLLKPDNKCEGCVDIILLSEIITNFTYSKKDELGALSN
jgi:hypothetical protein